MPRIPRAWLPYFHAQAVRRGSPMNYRPGYQGSGQQPIVPVRIQNYTQKATGVPLTGGQNQAVIPGLAGVTGSATSPAGFSEITGSITVPSTGIYTVNWTVTLAGTTSSADVNNFALVRNDAVVIAVSVNGSTPGSYPQSATVSLTAGDTLLVGTNTNNATSGAVYSAAILAQGGTLTLTAGPQGLGTIWYPAQVTLSTTTGALDTSTALVYLGSQGVPIALVGTVFTGNGTVALAIPDMSPGQVLIVTWTNGHPGDTAAFNIVGTMDALTTGR
jgi:hypothetical protein